MGAQAARLKANTETIIMRINFFISFSLSFAFAGLFFFAVLISITGKENFKPAGIIFI